MAKAFRFTRNHSPGEMADKIARRAHLVPQAPADLARSEAERYASEAKQNRPWQDRTNSARAGLGGTSIVESNGNVSIYLFHTVSYGPMLELGTVYARAFPIIEPTIQKEAPATMEAAGDLVRRILAGE